MPLGLGGSRLGAGLGPGALRLAGIVDHVRPVVEEIYDGGDIQAIFGGAEANKGEGIAYFREVIAYVSEVREAVAEALGPQSIPLVLGGDHSIEMATIPAAVEHYGEAVGVLWIDAHGDINTPDTSPSGNLHGMALAAICGIHCGPSVPKEIQEQWKQLLAIAAPSGKYLRDCNIVWMGLRDLDPGETTRITGENPMSAISMHEIDRFGIPAMVHHAMSELRKAGAKKLWISFDADVLDPFIAPGTGTAVRGGLTYREAHLIAELLHQELVAENSEISLAGITVAEVNPVLDRQNETASMCVEWVGSLLGRRILPPWERSD